MFQLIERTKFGAQLSRVQAQGRVGVGIMAGGVVIVEFCRASSRAFSFWWTIFARTGEARIKARSLPAIFKYDYWL